jgi:hypothetical protein
VHALHHERVAAFLGGVPDPVGDASLADLKSAGVPIECLDARCADGGGLGRPG